MHIKRNFDISGLSIRSKKMSKKAKTYLFHYMFFLTILSHKGNEMLKIHLSIFRHFRMDSIGMDYFLLKLDILQ